jgi:hypothetical protein
MSSATITKAMYRLAFGFSGGKKSTGIAIYDEDTQVLTRYEDITINDLHTYYENDILFAYDNVKWRLMEIHNNKITLFTQEEMVDCLFYKHYDNHSVGCMIVIDVDNGHTYLLNSVYVDRKKYVNVNAMHINICMNFIKANSTNDHHTYAVNILIDRRTFKINTFNYTCGEDDESIDYLLDITKINSIHVNAMFEKVTSTSLYSDYCLNDGDFTIATDMAILYIVDTIESNFKRSSFPCRTVPVINGLLLEDTRFIAPPISYRHKVENLLLNYLPRDVCGVILDYMHTFNKI